MTSVPPAFDRSLHAFISGSENPKAPVHVDEMYGTPLRMLLDRFGHDEVPDFDPSDPAVTRSAIRPDLTYVPVMAGVLLIDARPRIVGAYLSSDLALRASLRGLGLGRELVIEYASRFSHMRIWRHAAYTPAGLATHESAWRFVHANLGGQPTA